MSKLSDRAYRSKTITMIQSFTVEQKDEKLLAQYIRNRKLEETIKKLELLNTEQAEELEDLRLQVQRLENRLKFDHIPSYRIRYITMNTLDAAYDYMVLDEEKVIELTAIVYYHHYDPKNQRLAFVDHEYVDQYIRGVTKVLPF